MLCLLYVELSYVLICSNVDDISRSYDIYIYINYRNPNYYCGYLTPYLLNVTPGDWVTAGNPE